MHIEHDTEAAIRRAPLGGCDTLVEVVAQFDRGQAARASSSVKRGSV